MAKTVRLIAVWFITLLAQVGFNYLWQASALWHPPGYVLGVIVGMIAFGLMQHQPREE